MATDRLPNPELRRLRAAAQRLPAALKVGKAGLSPQFIQGLDEALRQRELIKVRFDEFKDQKKELARELAELAERTSSHLVMQVGHVVVLYRKRDSEGAPPAAET